MRERARRRYGTARNYGTVKSPKAGARACICDLSDTEFHLLGCNWPLKTNHSEEAASFVGDGPVETPS